MFKKGFTLIELLVVIAIIAILAAILFPVFAQAREKARASACLSNTKQIGTALQLYIDDYDETYPLHCDGWAPLWKESNANYYLSQASCVRALEPYIKNMGCWKCPSASKKYLDGVSLTATDLCSYNVNMVVFGECNSVASKTANPVLVEKSTCPAKSMSEITRPSSIIVISDGPYYFNYCVARPSRYQASYGNMMKADANTNQYRVAKGEITFKIHTDGMNCTYCDGHAKYNKVNALKLWDFGAKDTTIMAKDWDGGMKEISW